MQDSKNLNRSCWRFSLNQTMHFWNRTRIALNDFRIIFLSYFNLSNFLSWLIISDRQCFKRKCQFQEIVFVKMFLRDWTALTNFSTDRYFKRDKCYVLVLSTSTSHLVISSSLSIRQACLTILIILQLIELLDSLIMLKLSTNELKNEQKISNESFTKRFTKKFILWYSHHDLKMT